ncbi:MAG TPA: phospho-N-acetylmuramoyl-pentapeptide-transferase [Tepidisphaeraceae bacterium]|nr:phospho-N-acetylmuramoyl-pentapeptide-transferase [Tepidisphaeraceae bacterium]
MLFLLVQRLHSLLEAHHLGFLRVFNAVEFQATAAMVLSFIICIIMGPRTIAWLRQQKIGDNPDFDQADINKMMEGKKGTPTMGGVLIISSILVTTLLLADLSNFYVNMAIVCVLLLGAVGAADDWLKLTVARREGNRQGLTSLEKLLFQLGIAAILSVFTYRYGGDIAETKTLYFPLLKNIAIPLGVGIYVLLGTLVLTGSSNAVNLTDGLDGLASGCMTIASFTFVILAIIVGNRVYANALLIPHIEKAGQMAVVAGAMVGSCLGFLWFNCNPARVFMGDTGSLALGGLIGYIAMVIRHELLLVFIGGIFVAEALSVMIQVSYFKYTKRKYGAGRRIFLMSPLHHHFQKKGWSENQVVVRFWLISFMLAAMALATIKLR